MSTATSLQRFNSAVIQCIRNLAPIVIDMDESTTSFMMLSIGGKAARSIAEQTDMICLRQYATACND